MSDKLIYNCAAKRLESGDLEPAEIARINRLRADARDAGRVAELKEAQRRADLDALEKADTVQELREIIKRLLLDEAN